MRFSFAFSILAMAVAAATLTATPGFGRTYRHYYRPITTVIITGITPAISTRAADITIPNSSTTGRTLDSAAGILQGSAAWIRAFILHRWDIRAVSSCAARETLADSRRADPRFSGPGKAWRNRPPSLPPDSAPATRSATAPSPAARRLDKRSARTSRAIAASAPARFRTAACRSRSLPQRHAASAIAQTDRYRPG